MHSLIRKNLCTLIILIAITLSLRHSLAEDQAAMGVIDQQADAIPEAIVELMKRHSWRPDCPVGLADLAYLRIEYWGFDARSHSGELIVHRKLAEEVRAIFDDLHRNKFPIQQMRLIDAYDGDDTLSMKDNNTSAFNCRPKAGSKQGFSKHAFGLAIDINPLLNPYIKGAIIKPSEGSKYGDRSLNKPGMIRKGDACHQAFLKRGWTWGGTWRTMKDYQHFEKRLAL